MIFCFSWSCKLIEKSKIFIPFPYIILTFLCAWLHFKVLNLLSSCSLFASFKQLDPCLSYCLIVKKYPPFFLLLIFDTSFHLMLTNLYIIFQIHGIETERLAWFILMLIRKSCCLACNSNYELSLMSFVPPQKKLSSYFFVSSKCVQLLYLFQFIEIGDKVNHLWCFQPNNTSPIRHFMFIPVSFLVIRNWVLLLFVITCFFHDL